MLQKPRKVSKLVRPFLDADKPLNEKQHGLLDQLDQAAKLVTESGRRRKKK